MEKVCELYNKKSYNLRCCASIYSAVLATQVPKIKVDLGLGVLYDEKDPGLQKLNQVHDLFGNDQIATVLIKVDDMFSVDSLTRLEKFHTTIEEKTPFIESVDSIYSSGLYRDER